MKKHIMIKMKSKNILKMITGYYTKHCTSQDMIMGNDVLITPILHKESSRYHAQLCKSKLFIQMERRGITLHHSVKLKYPETQFFPCSMQCFTNASPI